MTMNSSVRRNVMKRLLLLACVAVMLVAATGREMSDDGHDHGGHEHETHDE